MAGGSIFAGSFAEPYDVADSHSRMGVLIALIPATVIILFITSPFQGLIYSQMLLSIQLPITIFTLIYLTSSKKVMGKYANSPREKALLWAMGLTVTVLDVALFITSL
jgi:manganese transport protein